MFMIYMATNTVNGKRYIGFTGRGMPFRRARHLELARKGSRACPRLYDAIRKYGADKFVWSTVAEFDDRTEALRHEYELVDRLGHEYNAAPGGNAGPVAGAGWNKRAVVCLEDGQVFESAKAAARHYRADFSEISKACKLQTNTVLDRHFQFFTIDLSEIDRRDLIASLDADVIRKRARGRTVPALPPVNAGKDRLGRSAAGPMSNACPIICLDDGQTFESISAAAHHYGVDASAVTELCRGQRFRKTVGGKRFAYVGTRAG